MNILIILGTARNGRKSERAAKFILKELKNIKGVEFELVDVRDYGSTQTVHSKTDSKTFTPYREKVEKADGYIIVTPEYNRSFPGELKILLDSAYAQYKKKPVLIGSVSSGRFGGFAVAHFIKPTLIEMGMIPMSGGIYFSNIGDLVDESGNVSDDAFVERVKQNMEEFMWYVRALKTARENE